MRGALRSLESHDASLSKLIANIRGRRKQTKAPGPSKTDPAASPAPASPAPASPAPASPAPASALDTISDPSPYSDVYLRLTVGELLAQAGDVVGALSDFRKAARNSPAHPLPYLNAARVYSSLQQPRLARLHLQRALMRDPTFSQTYTDMASVLLAQVRPTASTPHNTYIAYISYSMTGS